MKKYKIAVYAICKNEIKHILRWYESIKDADEIIVVDTGSTDGSVEKLKSLGITVIEKEIKPWRFDEARNIALSFVPDDIDICVAPDLDELFENGWYDALQNTWDENTTRISYQYNWSLDKNNKPIVSFYANKIHSRNNYTWTHPVHEVLTFTNKDKDEVEKICNDIVLNHYPDQTKSRSSYLPLLELSVKENPEDDRNMHYLGREYMYYGKWNECIDTLIKHLNLKTATWHDERCASMRFIARSYSNLNRYNEAKMWLEKAIIEAPHLRDPYVEMAILEYKYQNYDAVEKYCLDALKITTHQKTYINEVFSWDYSIYDLLSLSYYYRAMYNKALKYVKLALKMDPENERLKKNLIAIKEKTN